MMKSIFLFAMAVFVMSNSCHSLHAQELGLWYDTELQITPKGQINHVNLLYLSADYSLNERFKLSAATISIAKTREESLLDDLQAFSNVEADNVPLTLAVAGLGWNVNDHHSLFFGIRSVTEDYFTSPVTALFTNSSCGIFPTISCNQEIANYPLAAVGVHYGYTIKSFNLMASLYNGIGHQGFVGRQNVWRVTPNSDGLFAIAQADYTYRDNSYYLGVSYHSGTSDNDFSSQSTIWGYTEQMLTERIALIAGLSHALGRSCICTDFVGLGGQYAMGKSKIGVFTDYARFRNDNEWATELTYRRDLTSTVFLQASYHFIHHDTWQSIALLRVGVRI